MAPSAEPVVVRTAWTPSEAKVLVALLQAEGIPAHVDGDTLVDEFIMSRRLMNLTSIKVLVPANAAARAREILDEAAVDEQELTAQALASAPDPSALPPAGPYLEPRRAGAPWSLVIGLAALAFVFLGLWRGARARLGAEDPLYATEWTGELLRVRLRATGNVSSEYFDRDRDGHYEEIRGFDAQGRLRSAVRDLDGDGRYEELTEYRASGERAEYRDADGDTLYESCTILDESGRELRRQRWDGERGWVDQD